ncbi:cysteine hydrolase family protein [Dongia soli]|uniref:Cysteine hydrolase family protein n=1 Tax=Dongia soli TaxID=600628 RepID=A0ABU5EHP3_9PROT|nr:cysteine hydrolase family protein [Dongia soli]MDY0885559.1 cysteine hydrolase family protein [Dongia soli]
MTTPRTLLQHANAPLHPSALSQSAVIVIDAQEEYRSGRLPLPGIDAATAEIADLLAIARQHHMPIFHVLQQGRPGGLFDPQTPFAQAIPTLAAKDGEQIVVKSLPNAFAKTSLDELIRASGRTELIIVGFMTHMCVSATARAALDLGYRSTIVANATATGDLPDPLQGSTITAAELHRNALAALADRFAIVVRDVAALTKG